jgi:hypothetical protein
MELETIMLSAINHTKKTKAKYCMFSFMEPRLKMTVIIVINSGNGT